MDKDVDEASSPKDDFTAEPRFRASAVVEAIFSRHPTPVEGLHKAHITSFKTIKISSQRFRLQKTMRKEGNNVHYNAFGTEIPSGAT